MPRITCASVPVGGAAGRAAAGLAGGACAAATAVTSANTTPAVISLIVVPFGHGVGRQLARPRIMADRKILSSFFYVKRNDPARAAGAYWCVVRGLERKVSHSLSHFAVVSSGFFVAASLVR